MLIDLYNLIGLNYGLTSLTCNDVPYEKELSDKFITEFEVYLHKQLGIPTAHLTSVTHVITIINNIDDEDTANRIKVLYALYQIILLGIPENVGIMSALPLIRQNERHISERKCKVDNSGVMYLPNNRTILINKLDKSILLLSKFIDVFGERAQLTEHGFLYIPSVFNTPYYLKLVRETNRCCISTSPTIFSSSLQLNKRLLKTIEQQVNDILVAYELTVDTLI